MNGLLSRLCPVPLPSPGSRAREWPAITASESTALPASPSFSSSRPSLQFCCTTMHLQQAIDHRGTRLLYLSKHRGTFLLAPTHRGTYLAFWARERPAVTALQLSTPACPDTGLRGQTFLGGEIAHVLDPSLGMDCGGLVLGCQDHSAETIRVSASARALSALVVGCRSLVASAGLP